MVVGQFYHGVRKSIYDIGRRLILKIVARVDFGNNGKKSNLIIMAGG